MRPNISIICSCYKSDRYLDSYFKNVLAQTAYPDLQVVIHFSSPSQVERQVLQRYAPIMGDHLNFEISENLIPIYSAWNNCVNRSIGEYLCVWNVDDRRPPDSLASMARTLDESPEVLFTYGDHITVRKLGQEDGTYNTSYEYDAGLFRTGMFLGPFFMWRKEAVKSVGLFDEQFFSGGDFDYAVRLTFAGIGKKTHKLVGYYLNEGRGVSTGSPHVPRNNQPIERTVIESRYGMYEKTILLRGFPYIRAAQEYHAGQILVHGKWLEIGQVVPGYAGYMQQRIPNRWKLDLGYALWKIYRHPVALYQSLARVAKNILRPVYQRLVR